MRRGAKPVKAKVKAARPSSRKSPKTETSRTRRLEKRLAEALEQQRATSEILRVISSSPTDLQSVLDTVAERAARLCNANDASVFRIEGDVLRLVATYGTTVPVTTLVHERGVPISRGAVSGRAVVDRQTIHVHDVAAELDTEYQDARPYQQRAGFRTALATPLLREGVPLGAILIRRMEVRPFSEEQIELLKTFADQAVIAIENVRLFKELQARAQPGPSGRAGRSSSARLPTSPTSRPIRSSSIEPCPARSAFEAVSPSQCCGKALPSASSLWRVPRLDRFPTARWICSRLLPTRPSSPSRACACSRNWRRGRAS